MSELTSQKDVQQQNNVSGGGGIGGCGGCALAVLFAILLIVSWIISSNSKQKAENEAARNRVRAEQLVFTDLQLKPGPIYELTGRVKNNSKYNVSSISLKVRIFDCNAQSHCDVVAESSVYDILISGIPSGQVRDIDASVFVHDKPQFRGRFQWDYQITEIIAHK